MPHTRSILSFFRWPLAIVCLGPGLCTAATWTVVNTNDAGTGSLRGAISSAAPGDTINFSLTYPVTITLTSAALSIKQNLVISGPGSSNLSISGGGSLNVFSIAAGANVNISGITVTGGAFMVFLGGSGAGIANAGTLILTNSTVAGNSANSTRDGNGGGIWNVGSLAVINCSVSNNTAFSNDFPAYGGGIYNAGTASIINSSLSGNSVDNTVASASGGAIYNNAYLTITNSTITGNRATGSGGGIYNVGTLVADFTTVTGNSAGAELNGSGGGIFNGGTLSINNSNVSSNRASGLGSFGGGVANSGSATLISDTVAGNSAVSGATGFYNSGTAALSHLTLSGNGISNTTGATLTIKSSILSNTAANCSFSAGGTAVSAGYNLSDDASCASVLNNAGDLNETPSGLDPNGLGDNGGPTQTIALLPNSPAIDAVPAGLGGFCTAADGVTPVTTDQRTVGRPQGTGCDAGAFEATSSAAVLTLTKLATSAPAVGQAGATYSLTVANAATAGPTNGMVTVTDTLPGGLTAASMSGAGWSCAATTCTRSDVLAAGASYPPITLVANVAPTAVSPVVNSATVMGGSSSNGFAAASALLIGAPALTIRKTHSGNFSLGQQGAIYTLTVSNTAGAGPTAGAVTVADLVPGGMSLVSLAGNGWSCGNSSCSRADVLAAGTSYPAITATVNVSSQATSPQVNTATVSGGGWATSTASDTTTITGVAVLTIAKTHAGNFSLGQQGTYTIVVNNQVGAGPTNGTVTVADNLPGGLSLISIGGTGWSCAGSTCSRGDPLAGGTSYPAITVTVSVAAHATSPQINNATVSGGGSEGASVADTTVISGVPVLSLSKSHSGNFSAGQQGTYTLTVSNAAGAGSTNGAVSVSDIVPGGLSLVSMSGTGWSCSGNTCSRGDVLGAGTSYQPITVIVNVAATASSPQVNHASVSGGGAAFASASDSTTIVYPALGITKTHSGNFSQLQQGATYSLTVSNGAGAAPAAGAVTVSDNLPGGLTLVSMSGTGWSCSFSTCSRGDALPANASYPPILVTVNVSPTAPPQVTNMATVSGGGSAGATASDPTNIQQITQSISGTVTAGGVGLGGATVSVIGSVSSSVMTNANGSYSIGGLSPGGTYTVFAALSGYSFSGPVTISNLTANQTVNFTGVAVPGLQFYPVTPCRLADTRVSSFPAGFGPPSMSAGTTRTFNIPSNTVCGIPVSAAAYSLNVTAVTKGYLGILTIWPAGQAMPNASTLNSYATSTTAVSNAAIVPAGTAGAINVFVTDATDVVMDIDGFFAPPSASGLVYYPVTPCRLVDTRVASFPAGFGPPSLGAGTSRQFMIQSSSACAIASTAAAYSLNVTAIPRKTLGFLSIWPTGQALPNVSTLNVYNSGTVVANAAIVPAGTGGAISVFVTDATDLVIDIDGYFAPPTAGGLKLYPVSPCRVADTRVSTFPPGLGPPSMAAGTQRSFAVAASPCAIPPGAGAYSFNFTAVPQAPQLGIFITWPTGGAQPNVSTMNSYNGSVVSNAAIVPAGNGGAISIYVTDASDVLFDINGYFAP